MDRTSRHADPATRAHAAPDRAPAPGRASLTADHGASAAPPAAVARPGHQWPSSVAYVDEATASAHGLVQFDASGPAPALDGAHARAAGGGGGAPAVQRQEAPAAEPDAEEGPIPTPQLDPSLERLLDEIAPVPQVPSHETMTGTNAADNSDGRLTERTMRWHRDLPTFTAASRQAAREPGGRGQVPLASPQTPGSEAFQPRWAVALLCSNYPGTRSDLPEIALLGPNACPFQTALAGEFSERRTVRNPTAEQIRQAVYAAIVDMIPHLESGQVAELLVNFQGHGQGGAIDGVDWGQVTVADQAQMAAFARDHNIHMTFVLDTCTAGDAVAEAQGARGAALRQRQGELGEAGRQRLVVAGNLWARLRSLNAALVDAYALRGAVATAAGRQRAEDAFRAFVEVATALDGNMQRLPPVVDLTEHRAQLARACETASRALEGTLDRAAIMRLRRAAVPAISRISNTVTQLLEQVQAELDGAGATGGGDAAAAGGDAAAR